MLVASHGYNYDLDITKNVLTSHMLNTKLSTKKIDKEEHENRMLELIKLELGGLLG